MSATEQPPKKRKLYEAISDPPIAPPHHQVLVSGAPPPPPSQEEIIRKRRNKDEIRSLVECYRRIKFCASQKDAGLMPELEQAYLSLITASRGCSSVQRIVAELIPRYAAFCPTALEAAARVSINMYNWSLAIIVKGEDVDGVAYETVKACIFGLVDICCTASHEAPTSSVIQGICSAVFSNILTFFVSTFEGKDIYQIGSREVLKLQDPMDFLHELKHETKYESETVLHREGQYFLNQMTSHLSDDENDATTESLSMLENLFGSLSKSVDGTDFEGSGGNKFDASNHDDVSHPYLVYPLQNEDIGGVSKDSGIPDASPADACKRDDGSAEKTMGEREGNSIHGGDRLATNRKLHSGNRKESDTINYQSFNADLGMPSFVSVSGGAAKTFSSPNEHSPAQSSASTQFLWYCDGDPRAMDVTSASKQLWVSSLGHDATETTVRLQFEDFGALQCFLFFPDKDFALVEYRNILDAVKARKCMQGSSLWGGCLHIKFLDRGLGSRAAFNGIAVGDSCFVYVGNVSTQRLKDEILHELLKVGLRNPPIVTSLTSENALLLEFSSAEEAASAIGHIRCFREASGCQASENRKWKHGAYIKDKSVSGCQLLVKQVDASVPHMELINAFSRFGEITGWQFDRLNGCCYIDFQSHEAANLAKSHLRGARFGSTTVEVEIRSGNTGSAPNNVLFSPRAPSLHDVSADHWKARMSQLSSLFSSLHVKYNLNQNLSYESNKQKNYSLSTKDEVPVSTLYITLPGISFMTIEDDDIRALCNLAVGNLGSVVRLTRIGLQSSCWHVEFSSVDAAVTALDNIRSCSETFLQAEFRNNRVVVCHEESVTPRKLNTLGYSPSPGEFRPAGLDSKHGNPYVRSFTNKPDLNVHIPVSPRVNVENIGFQVQHGQAFQSNWTVASSADMREVPMDLSFPGPATSAGEKIWHYMKQENEPHMFGKVNLPSRTSVAHVGSVIPPPVPTSLVRPVYLTPSNSWDNSGPSPLLNRTSTSMMLIDNRNINACAPVPFIPSSITPLSQLPGGAMQRFDQVVTVPGLSNVVHPPPPPSDVPPPLPLSQPPSVPPPPSSPPPLQQPKDSDLQASVSCPHHQWQGTLSKSGVHYCTIYAVREDSVACKYSTTLSEPADWPARLDVTKRTDIQHVKSTFSNTPPHKLVYFCSFYLAVYVNLLDSSLADDWFNTWCRERFVVCCRPPQTTKEEILTMYYIVNYHCSIFEEITSAWWDTILPN
ncbi:RRM [Musa troglodytarum]|uniref:RRM n=1 Tax=Musa troglodytarum TaxID=320322 RepID=A0A9E7GMV6_9LILI|nr:RRM [Musa troglodytarum]